MLLVPVLNFGTNLTQKVQLAGQLAFQQWKAVRLKTCEKRTQMISVRVYNSKAQLKLKCRKKCTSLSQVSKSSTSGSLKPLRICLEIFIHKSRALVMLSIIAKLVLAWKCFELTVECWNAQVSIKNKQQSQYGSTEPSLIQFLSEPKLY